MGHLKTTNYQTKTCLSTKQFAIQRDSVTKKGKVDSWSILCVHLCMYFENGPFQIYLREKGQLHGKI